MAGDYFIVKDRRQTVQETVNGVDLTGPVEITWAIMPEGISYDGDIDAAIAADNVTLRDNGGVGGVVVDAVGPPGIFTATVRPGDSRAINPGPFRVFVRITDAAGHEAPLPSYMIDVVV